MNARQTHGLEGSADSDIYPNKESEVVGFSVLVGKRSAAATDEPEMDQGRTEARTASAAERSLQGRRTQDARRNAP
jgi:hypothetical protein